MVAGRRPGAGPLWALGGSALGVCLAGVAGQLVEVRPGGGGGGSGGAVTVQAEDGVGGLSDWELRFPFLSPWETWLNEVTCPKRLQAVGRQPPPRGPWCDGRAQLLTSRTWV